MGRLGWLMIPAGLAALLAADTPAHAGCVVDGVPGGDGDGWFTPGPSASGGANFCRTPGAGCTACPAGPDGPAPEDPHPGNNNCGPPNMSCSGDGDATCGVDTCRQNSCPPGPGDPVDAAGGSVYRRDVDLTARWGDFTYVFERNFNNMLTSGALNLHITDEQDLAEERGFGPGWMHSGGEQLLVDRAACSASSPSQPCYRLRFRMADTKGYWFTPKGNSYHLNANGSPEGDGETMTPPAGGEFILRVEDDDTISIPSAGEVEHWSDLVTGVNRRLVVIRVSDGKQWLFRHLSGYVMALVEIRERGARIVISSGNPSQHDIFLGHLAVGRVCIWRDAAQRITGLRLGAPERDCEPTKPSADQLDAAYGYDGAVDTPVRSVNTDGIARTTGDYSSDIGLRYEYEPLEERRQSIPFTYYLLKRVWRHGTEHDVEIATYAYKHVNLGDPRVTKVTSVKSEFEFEYPSAIGRSQTEHDNDATKWGSTLAIRSGGTQKISTTIRYDSRHHYVDMNNSAGECGTAHTTLWGRKGYSDCTGPGPGCVTGPDGARMIPFSALNPPAREEILSCSGFNGDRSDPCFSQCWNQIGFCPLVRNYAYDGRPRMFFHRETDHHGMTRSVPMGDVRNTQVGFVSADMSNYDHRGRPKKIEEHDRFWEAVDPDIDPLYKTAYEYLDASRPWLDPESFVWETRHRTALPNASGDTSRRQDHERYGFVRHVSMVGATCAPGEGPSCTPHTETIHVSDNKRETASETYLLLSTIDGTGRETRFCNYGLDQSGVADCNLTAAAFPLRGRLAATSLRGHAASDSVFLTTWVRRYDNVGHPLVTLDQNGLPSFTAYDHAGRLLATMGPLGDITGYCYEPGTGLLRGIHHPEGNFTTYAHDDYGRVSLIRHHGTGQRNASRTACASDDACLSAAAAWANCALARESDADEWTQFTYNGEGQVATRRDGKGQLSEPGILREERSYAMRLDQVTGVSVGGGTRTFEYEQVSGDLMCVTDERGTVTRYYRNGWGKVYEEVTWAAGVILRFTKYGYDHRQNLRVVQVCGTEACLNADGRTAPTTPCAQPPPLGVAMPLDWPRPMALSALVPGPTPDYYVTTYYTYDDFGRLVSLDSPDSGVTRFDYDAAGRLVGKHQYSSRNATAPISSIVYGYDDLGRLQYAADMNSSPSFVEGYGWDEDESEPRPNLRGRLAAVWVLSQARANPFIKRFSYDATGRLTREELAIDGQRLGIAYEYDTNGNIVSTTYPSGQVVHQELDPARLRVTGLTAGTGNTVRPLANGLAYQPGGGITAASWANGRSTTWTRDERSLITQVATAAMPIGSLTVDRLGDGTPDIARGLPALLDGAASKTIDYGTDALGRLNSATELNNLGAQVTYTYAMHPNDNREQTKVVAPSFTKLFDYLYFPGSDRISFVIDPSTESTCAPSPGGGDGCFGGAPTTTVFQDVFSRTRHHGNENGHGHSRDEEGGEGDEGDDEEEEGQEREFTLSEAAEACIELTQMHAASAHVGIDDVEVYGPSDFNATVTTLRKTIALDAGTHELRVEIGSFPDASFILAIRVASGGRDGGSGDCASGVPPGLQRAVERLLVDLERLLRLVQLQQQRDPTVTTRQVRKAARHAMSDATRVAELSGTSRRELLALLEAYPVYRNVIDSLLHDGRLPPDFIGLPTLATAEELTRALTRKPPKDPILKYGYDGRGNVTEIQPVKGPGDANIRTGRAMCWAYDAKGRVWETGVGVVYPDLIEPYYPCSTGVLELARMSYDEKNLRVEKTAAGRTTRFVYDQQGNLLAEADGATGAVLKEYVWLNGELTVMRRYPAAEMLAGSCESSSAEPFVFVLIPLLLLFSRRRRSIPVLGIVALTACGVNEPRLPRDIVIEPLASVPEDYYVHNDWLATPVAMTDMAGRVVWRSEHDPYGRTAVDEDPDGDGREVSLNIRFPGQYEDEETSMFADLTVGQPFIYNWNRYYAPQDGRYLQPDPLDALSLGGPSWLDVGTGPVPKALVPSAIRSSWSPTPSTAYSYSDARPTSTTDPSGLSSLAPGWPNGDEPVGSPACVDHDLGTCDPAVPDEYFIDTCKNAYGKRDISGRPFDHVRCHPLTRRLICTYCRRVGTSCDE